VASDVVHVKAANEADLAAYRGTLRGKIVIMQPVRAVRMLEDPVILRMDDGPWWTEAATPQEQLPQVQPPAGAVEAARARQQFAAAVQKFLVDEGVGVLLERGNDADTASAAATSPGARSMTDGGTIFPDERR
jgi:hypothetical protein